MPALERAIGVEAVVAIHLAIVGSIPPDEMAETLAIMLPAMNVDDRTELLGGMQADRPAGGVRRRRRPRPLRARPDATSAPRRPPRAVSHRCAADVRRRLRSGPAPR